MKKLTAFWRACDLLASAGVMQEWELEVRDPEVLAVGRQLLIETDQESTSYPCIMSPRCGCSHEVFTDQDGTKVAVCACDDHDCETFPVEANDLVIHELDVARVFRALSKVTGLDLAVSDTSGAIRRMGEFSPSPGTHIPVYFVQHAGADGLSGVMHDLALAESGSFFLVTITLPRREPAVRQVADRRGVLLLSLEELVFGNEEGTPGVDTHVNEVVDRFVRKTTPTAPVAFEIDTGHKRSTIPESIFRYSDDFHNIWIHGKMLPPLSDMQADMVKVLYEAAMNGEPELRFAAVASRMTDPPGRFDNIFRLSDPRRTAIRLVRRGVYQINI